MKNGSKRGVIFFIQKPNRDHIEQLKTMLIDSGMRETHCSVCGCLLLTREDDTRCPPCRMLAN